MPALVPTQVYKQPRGLVTKIELEGVESLSKQELKQIWKGFQQAKLPTPAVPVQPGNGASSCALSCGACCLR